MDRLSQIFAQHKITLLLALSLSVLLSGGFFVFKNIISPQKEVILEEINLSFDPEGPYALLVPRRDGNALNLIVKRISSYESFTYVLPYLDKDGVGRGAGDPNTWITIEPEKGEFEQEILFGSCSQGFTSGKEHCLFDEGVEYGTLDLKFKKGNKAYLMKMKWHQQKPDVALGKLTSADEHFSYTTQTSQGLQVIGFSIIGDLSGVPKLPGGKKVLGKVYALNIPIAKTLPEGEVMVELVDNPPAYSQIARFDELRNDWEILETETNKNKLTSQASGAGIYAVLIGEDAN